MSDVTGYSSRVALSLVVGDQELALSLVHPGSVIVRDACEPIPPSDAKLIVEIDGQPQVRDVYLPDGIPNAPQRVSYI